MTKSRKLALLWFVGGVAFLVAGLLSSPRQPFALAAGLLYFAVAITTLKRG
jgi:hypothetical protein